MRVKDLQIVKPHRNWFDLEIQCDNDVSSALLAIACSFFGLFFCLDSMGHSWLQYLNDEQLVNEAKIHIKSI